jgi:hypothetical protein
MLQPIQLVKAPSLFRHFLWPKPFLQCFLPIGFNQYGNVEKSRQRRSRHFAVLTYWKYAPRVKLAAALLDGLF